MRKTIRRSLAAILLILALPYIAFAQGTRRTDAQWDASTAQDTTLVLNVSDMGSAIIWMRPVGSITGGHLTFECSINGGISWVALSGSNGDRTQTGVALTPASGPYDGQEAGWRFPVQSMDLIRVRLDTAVTGTGVIVVSIRTNPVSVTPFLIARQSENGRLISTVQGDVANGTAEASPASPPIKSGGVAWQKAGETVSTLSNFPTPVAAATRATNLMTPYNEVRVALSDKYIDGTITALAQTQVIPMEGMGTIVFAMPVSTFTGTLVFEESTDQSAWVSITGVETGLSTFVGSTSTVCAATCAGAWQFSTGNGYRWFRIRASAWTSGTAVVRIVAYPIVRSMQDSYSVPFERQDHPNRFRCTVTVSTATTIQAVGGSCVAPGSGLSLYVTDISFSTSAAGIAADAFPTLKYGTGGTCGTGTTVFWGQLSAAAMVLHESFKTPIKIPANNEICWITTTAGSKFVVVTGFIAP